MSGFYLRGMLRCGCKKNQFQSKETEMFTNRLFYLLIVIALLVITACIPVPAQAPTPTLIAPTATIVPSTPTLTNALTITSTLDNQTTLPHRIQWVAMPSVSEDQVSEVDFLIDGQLAFVENHEPYTYGRDGNYLVTSFLTPGEHNFTVRVVTVDDQSAESTVQATVEAAPSPPDGLANTSWTREMTASDRQKATSSEPPPSGIWGLDINSVGWNISYVSEDPERKTPQGFDVEYQSEGMVELRPTIERPVFPNDFGGSICEEPDTPFLWSYTISDDGTTLTLHPVGQDPCGDRVAILEGIWTREGN
jgi:hypothetical protein